MNKLLIIYDNVRKEEDYGNGRFVRSIIEEAEMNLAERIMKLKESEITTELITTIEECDIPVLKLLIHINNKCNTLPLIPICNNILQWFIKVNNKL